MQSFRDKKKENNAKVWISITVLVLLVIIAPFVFPGLGAGARSLVRPLWQLEKNIGTNTSDFFAGFRSRESLEAQNTNLENQNAGLSQRLIVLTTLENQNAALQEILGRKATADLVLGTILVKPNYSVYDTLVLDIGTEDGIAVGDNVYASGDIPIGTISSVSAKTAVATLYSTSGQKTTGRIDGQNTDVDLVGRGGGNFELQISRDITLTEGTNILLPSDTPEVLAVVAKNITDPRDPTQTFLLTSPVNVNELNWVEVEK